MGKEVKFTTKLPVAKLELNEGQLDGLPTNPRYIKDEKFAKLKLSLERSPEFLEANPLKVYPLDNGNYIIIGGNMRFLAGKEIGIKEFPCYIFAKETTTEKLKEFLIKDNVAYGNTDWDSLANNDWNVDDLDEWGMDVDFLKDVATEDEVEEKKEVEEDGYNPENDDEVEIIVQEGEVWQLGEHRLVCGDSTKAETISKLMNGETADLWLTDPPYNVGYGIDNHKRGNGDHVLNDKQDEESFILFLKDAFTCVKDILNKGASYYIFHSDSHGLSFRLALNDIGDMTLRQNLIWNKNSIVMGRQDYHWKHEPCLYGWKDGAGHHWYSDRKQSTVIDWDRPTVSELHPTMKPVGLFAYLMQNSSKKDDIVVDTFGGSGTTLIAAEQLGRKARLVELSPKYCSVIINRWEQLTGNKATKINI